MANYDMDITKNIKMIEGLQCQILSLIAQLFSSMQDTKATNRERTEILANMEIMTYLLADKLGVLPQALDQRVLNRLKLGMAEGDSNDDWNRALLGIYRHIDKSRESI